MTNQTQTIKNVVHELAQNGLKPKIGEMWNGINRIFISVDLDEKSIEEINKEIKKTQVLH